MKKQTKMLILSFYAIKVFLLFSDNPNDLTVRLESFY
jgi:hypothetical protein